MQTKRHDDSARHMDRNEEDLRDTLIAISVVAKRMANRIDEGKEAVFTNGTDERTQADS